MADVPHLFVMAQLYLTQQGSKLTKDHGRFVIQLPTCVAIEVPVREVEQVLLFGNIHLTTPAIATCLHYQIPVVFLSQQGSYKGHLWSAENEDYRAEAAQFEQFEEGRLQLAIAREIVRGKLWNSKQLLLKRNRDRHNPIVAAAIAGINRDLIAVEQLADAPTDLERLRGYEGTAAARYFPALGQLITSPDFTLTQRTRRPPTDPVNALLSFGYTLLFNNVLSLLRVEGLNPYLGNLHRSDRREAQLAFDLMEEFRSLVVDTLVLQLINQQVLKLTDFQPPAANGGVYLKDEPRRRFLQAFQDRMEQTVSHPDARESVPYRRAIQLQIRRYKQLLLQGIAYEAFRRET